MSLFNKIIILLCAAVFSQVPLFIEQYIMRLEGHIHESRFMVQQLHKTAHERGKILPEYIKKFLSSQDLDIQAQGIFIQTAVQRLQFLENAHTILLAKSSIIRPFCFPFVCDSSLSLETLHGYKIGFLCTKEVGIWSLLGAVVGAAFASCLLYSKRKIFPAVLASQYRRV